MLLRSLLMVSLLCSVYYVISTQCFTLYVYTYKYSITTLYYKIKHIFILHRSVVLLSQIVTAFSQLTLQAAQEIFLHLLEHFSEYQL